MEERPREYYRRLVDMAMQAGTIMMCAGAETHRAEETILYILGTSDFTHADAFVLSTGITITLSDPRYKTISITKRLFGTSTNFYNVYEVNNISRDFCAGKITIDEAEKRLNAIEKTEFYGDKLKLFSHILACAGFAIVFGGGFYEMLLALFCGVFLGIVNVYLGPRIKKGFMTTILGAAVVTLTAVGLSYFMKRVFNIEVGCQYVIVGSIMPLVPGVAITNAIRDTMQGDYVSGVARAMEAFMIATGVGLGVAGGFIITEWLGISLDVEFLLDNMNSLGLHALAAVFATAFALLGFCMIFSCPKKLVPIICAISSGAWLSYLIFVNLGFGSGLTNFASGVLVVIVSQILARKLKVPVTVFFIGGVLPLVPGYGIYRVAANIISRGDVGGALLNLLLVAGSIALSIIVTESVIDMIMRSIRYCKAKKFKKKLGKKH